MLDDNPRIPDEQVGKPSGASRREEDRLNNYREATEKADLDMLKAMSDIKVRFVRWGLPFLAFLLVIAILGFAVVMGVHYIGHPDWRWLDPPDIARIEGALGGVLTMGFAFAVRSWRRGA